MKALIPKSLGTRSQRINPWIPVDEPDATVRKTAAGYEFKEAQIKPTCQSYRVLTGQEPKRHFRIGAARSREAMPDNSEVFTPEQYNRIGPSAHGQTSHNQ